MRLESLTVRGFMTSFAGKEVTIDFTALPDNGLIAIVGDNGAGKTTLLEAAAAGIYRQMMSRDGDLKTYAQDRDSFIKTQWSIGASEYRSQLAVDGIKGGASAALTALDIDDGLRKLNDGKVSTFDDAIAKIFPPLHVFKASAFAAQNKSGSFVKASKKDRRDIFNAFLGLDRLVAMSETAKLAAAEVDKVRIRLQGEIAALEQQLAGLSAEDLRKSGQAASLAKEGHERDRDRLATEIAALEQDLQQLGDQSAAIAAAAQAVSHAGERHEARARELQAFLDADAAAAAEETRSRQQLTIDHDRQKSALTARAKAIETTLAADLLALTEATAAKLVDVDKRIKGNAEIQARTAEIEAAVASLATLKPRYQELRRLSEQEHTDERRIAEALSGAEKAVSAFAKPEAELKMARLNAGLLGDVPCGGAGAFAACQFLVNATESKARIATLEQTLAGITAAIQLRDRLVDEKKAALGALAETKRELVAIDEQMTALEKVAQYAEALKASTERIKDLQLQRATILQEQASSEATLSLRAAEARNQVIAEMLTLDRATDDAEDALRHRVNARVAAASTKRGDLELAEQHAKSLHKDAVDRYTEISAGNGQATELQAAIAAKRAAREVAITGIATATSDAAAITVRIEQLEMHAFTRRRLQQRLALLETELLEWRLLQDALDRDGLPALEVDIAGPRISATTNQILQDCFDSRFSVELVTQVAKADGKGMKDDFTLLVTDNHTGEIRDISDLSGGEEVIIAEAFMNAIALDINERSDRPMRTFFRDETTGALTKENTQRYVQMLRKVQALGGIRQILFISHDPEAQALADAQVRVADGQVSIVLPPYMAA